MWSDATVFAAVMATILISYANQWTPWQWVGALSIGLVASALMHWGIYAKGSLPEAHVRNGAVTSTGLVHFLYMAISLGILGLFYVCTKGLTPTYLFGVSLFLVLHMIIGSHLILKAWANATHPSWYPIQPVIDLTAGITIVGVAVVLSGASWWAVRQ
jgi:hypothetical protein